MRKRILSVVLAGALSASVIAGSAISASAVKNPDDTYTPGQGITARTYKFAMPGSWMTDYWKANENAAGIYWWTGAETPETVFTHAWPGYKVNRVNEEGVENLYSTPAPADANQIIFNAHIDGGMPGTEGFIQEKFDAARQIKDTPAQYYAFLESDYQTKDLWTYVWDKAADAVDADHIEWDMSDPKMTDAEADAIAELYETLQEEEVELDIPEFGEYSKNFFVEMENGDGIGMNFDNMV
ncbi:MAG: hypothetical protein IJ245_06725, partial [Lachnospiraceae bacterium]|nr:hypothetical protein [Lachnospiraceae bacterium]